MSDLDKLEFPSDDDLPEPERRIPPAGTIAVGQIRPDKDGVLGDFKSGDSGYGPWIILNFEITGGDYAGTWAGTILSVDPKDRRFRAVFTAVTGVDISAGGNVTFAEFKEKLIKGIFELEVGPDKRKNKETGQYEETGYTAVTKVLKRVGDRDDSAEATAPADEALVSPQSEGDEDIPF